MIEMQWKDGRMVLMICNNTGVIAPADYQTDLTVEQLDRDDTVLKSYIFRNAFPTIAAIELSMQKQLTLKHLSYLEISTL